MITGNWSYLPADVVMLVVLCLCDLSFYFIMQFLSLSSFLCILYFSLTAQFLNKRIVKSVNMRRKSWYKINSLEVTHPLDRSHWCKKGKLWTFPSLTASLVSASSKSFNRLSAYCFSLKILWETSEETKGMVWKVTDVQNLKEKYWVTATIPVLSNNFLFMANLYRIEYERAQLMEEYSQCIKCEKHR